MLFNLYVYAIIMFLLIICLSDIFIYYHFTLLTEALELSNITLVPGTKAGMTELGIQIHHGPSNSKNTTYEERLRTFVGWPTDHNQTPEMLSAAGFYYTGQDYI